MNKPLAAPPRPVARDGTGPAHGKDFYGWASHQATLARTGRLSELDAANLAEELESLGRQEFNELRNRLAVQLAHMLRWDRQPDRRARSWEATIREQRERVAELLEENPSLAPRLAEAIDKAYRLVRLRASGETDLPVARFPEALPYSWAEIAERPFSLDE